MWGRRIHSDVPTKYPKHIFAWRFWLIFWKKIHLNFCHKSAKYNHKIWKNSEKTKKISQKKVFSEIACLKSDWLTQKISKINKNMYINCTFDTRFHNAKFAIEELQVFSLGFLLVTFDFFGVTIWWNTEHFALDYEKKLAYRSYNKFRKSSQNLCQINFFYIIGRK